MHFTLNPIKWAQSVLSKIRTTRLTQVQGGILAATQERQLVEIKSYELALKPSFDIQVELVKNPDLNNIALAQPKMQITLYNGGGEAKVSKTEIRMNFPNYNTNNQSQDIDPFKLFNDKQKNFFFEVRRSFYGIIVPHPRSIQVTCKITYTDANDMPYPDINYEYEYDGKKMIRIKG